MADLVPVLEQAPLALLVILRISGLFIYGPVFGAPVIPIRIKAFLAIVLGLAVFPMVEVAPPELDLWVLVPLMARELLVGLVVGFLASLPLVAVQMGGLVAGQQLGLGLARFFNPALEDDADVVGQVLFFMALAGFLAIGGHDAMVRAMLESFRHVPLGGFSPDGGVLGVLIAMTTASLELALRVAAPVLGIIFLETVAMGFVAKTVTQLNILSLGFPVRILVGLGTVTLGLVVIDEVAMDGLDRALQVIFDLLGSGGAG